jgi:hypothetical protein
MMKIFIYFALIVGFLMFYQSNPVYTIVIIIIALGIYLFYRSRKGKGNGGRSRGGIRFLSGKEPPQNDSTDDLITLMMIQQIFSPSTTPDYIRYIPPNDTKQVEESEIDKIKREVLELLGDD